MSLGGKGVSWKDNWNDRVSVGRISRKIYDAADRTCAAKRIAISA